MSHSRSSRLIWGSAFLVAAGCGSDSGATTQGAEGQSCYPNGTCNAGLVCASQLCVVLPGNDGGQDASSSGGGTGTGGGTSTGGGGAGGASNGGQDAASSGGGGATDGGLDASSTGDAGGAPDAGPPCNVLEQTGCSAGQKCTWVRTGLQQGKIACAPDGTVDVNGACQYGSASGGSGYDDCRKGNVCLAKPNVDMAKGTCRSICDSTVAPGAQGSCSTGYACSVYSSFFSGQSTLLGLCDPTCNPLTQVRDWDGAAACGSPDPASPTLGCYGAPNGVFTCATAGPASNTSDVALPVLTLNGCAPGYAPLLHQDSMSSTAICVAYCQPAPTSLESHPSPGGTGAYTCAAKGAGGTHECRYWWMVEDPNLPATPHSNTLGLCFDYAKYTYTTGGTQQFPDPSCATVSTSDASYASWGCAPH